MFRPLVACARLLFDPVDATTRRRLAAKWAELPEHLRMPQQIYGRTEAGLGGGVDVETLWARVGEGLQDPMHRSVLNPPNTSGGWGIPIATAF